MSLKEIEESLTLLEKNWDVDETIHNFILGKIPKVTEKAVKVKDVVFHIPYLVEQEKFVLWKCFWPDCHNCCDRQGRLPLTSDDLITIGAGLKYQKVSDFIKNETVTATWEEPSPGGTTVMTNINLKRKKDETEADDGTHISCRFLDEKGGCSMHPDRPGVCYLYPFSTWLENEQGKARVHATFQFTGDCPGFYLADSIDEMKEILKEYSETIYDYNMKSNRTVRENFGSVSFV
ncbi:MAG: YkgJ family cysteine cluster protein [Crenarchaeota archaeon]|nr:MAG: YkgJ family cysteine cluster protein [Thermoproteota archaeon]RDJ33583.1 MAG: YkgJ family cysteine cluster protein [Thermoproteota archaeon]RDJ38094.1 MAG: YkgJ family cysteine cluster protein [Thermoproteota archaeon]RDJ39136.1 MAG: YkgJ family cysteine cluster protein [Thermoproteota archaeon]